LEGLAVLWFGEELESRVDVGPGDFLYIPPDVPHVPANASKLLPHLDGLPHLVL